MRKSKAKSRVSSLKARMPRPRRLSGKLAATLLVLSLLVTALLIPMAFQLPIWIEFEIVLAAWWGIWLVVLTALLVTGFRVTDDYALHTPQSWMSRNSGGAEPRKAASVDRTSEPGRWWTLANGPDDYGILIALIVLGLAIWVIFEFAIPAILFMLYTMARGMLARVANDRHRCRGNWGRALLWGSIWATAYTGVLALAIWFVHFVALMPVVVPAA